ncbi:ribosome recycling factor [Herpetosiphon geysericola]|uniref:Ribosome-recycling factor n=1 Tax=Herpetosiphon geysericola TaxID=70996 RepID=A0A0P6XYE1_9CHLR|nr:ribosome recycling factor [Herpetosiphon geysericola]KPL81235.1 ribosome recycling factor [Herpetosiphon geysericola]
MTVKDVLRDAETKMKKSIDSLRHTLGAVRTGRASPALVEDLKVEYYGAEMPLNQLANIATPESRMLTIQPYDQGAIKAIEKAIQNSELGINPSNDGRVIRLAIPQLTQERRKELVKQVKAKIEDGKVAIRNVRREAQDAIRKLQQDKAISEDDERRGQEDLQKLTDRFQKEVETIGATKEAEVMEV